MKWIIPIILCLLIVPPAFGQESVELTAPASATAVDGTITVETPDAETPAPAAEDAEIAPAPAETDAEQAVVAPAASDATPEAIVIPIVDPVDNPSTGDEVVAAAQKVKDAWYTKNYPAIAGAIIFLLLTLFRLPLLGSLTKKIPARIRILVAVGLSFVAAFLQVIALGSPWDVALLNILGTAPTAVFANELIAESLLGGRYKKAEATPKS